MRRLCPSPLRPAGSAPPPGATRSSAHQPCARTTSTSVSLSSGPNTLRGRGPSEVRSNAYDVHRRTWKPVRLQWWRDSTRGRGQRGFRCAQRHMSVYWGGSFLASTSSTPSLCTPPLPPPPHTHSLVQLLQLLRQAAARVWLEQAGAVILRAGEAEVKEKCCGMSRTAAASTADTGEGL